MEKLIQLLKSYQKIAIAYSGGCDSHFLYSVARNTLGKENVLAIMCQGDMMSKEDIESAKALIQDGLYQIIDIDVLSIEAFKYNHQDRCYHCKKTIMSLVKETAHKYGFNKVVDGMNADDLKVYRPGRKAVEELGILSPLALCNYSKSTIRQYSKELNIVTHNKPANACFASRFPYNTELTYEKLSVLDDIETYIHQLGILHIRCRIHDKLVRIEVEPQAFQTILEYNKQITTYIKSKGFDYVTLDLHGIVSGSYDKNI